MSLQCYLILRIRESYKTNIVVPNDEQHGNQAPTAAKFEVGTDFVSAGVLAGSAGSLLVGSGEGPGALADCGGLWVILAFFFLSIATRPKVG